MRSEETCKAHGIVSPVWNSPTTYKHRMFSQMHHPSIHKYFRTSNKSFPIDLLQNILCWSLFSSFFYLPLHAHSINRPFSI